MSLVPSLSCLDYLHTYLVVAMETGGRRSGAGCEEGGTNYGSEWIYKRPRLVDVAALPFPPSSCILTRPLTPAEGTPLPTREIAFFVRPCRSSPAPPLGYPDPDREELEYSDPEPEPEPDLEPTFDYTVERVGLPSAPSPLSAVRIGGGCSMERTASGLSISSGLTHASSSTREPENLGLLGDLEAAQLVREHLAGFPRRNRSNGRHERILRTLINPKNREAEFPIDEAALEGIFSAANEIFFASRLSNRVTWDWSHESAPQYQSSVIGTTALRMCKELGGYETLIVLSKPILMSEDFNRRLLISTFLHELIHSYLFVVCGMKARESGGHTEGFRQIAAMIDDWTGGEHLRLREMEADLESYRAEPEARHERQVYLLNPANQVQRERFQWDVSTPASEPDERSPMIPFRYSGDNAHPPILRLQPHRLLQSRSQASLHRQYDTPQHQHHIHHHHHHYHHHHHHYGHGEDKFHHHRRDGDWDEWIDDRWHGDNPAPSNTSVSTSIPILVPVSVHVTVPIRVPLGSEGAGAGGDYVGYNA
ncbi:uncharacterized protein DNG_10362 [Cephalotrichum gorgonifer]|uniref:SprT-like domain-containing protein n=1 Tax=Cephalotrichum gorgonifer TaxID=2041049 RepID=A0AAE8T0M3_9PEZI|nr:uncharacterized protein DNG_10362 [Cephalotrichum gorgonifer]